MADSAKPSRRKALSNCVNVQVHLRKEMVFVSSSVPKNCSAAMVQSRNQSIFLRGTVLTCVVENYYISELLLQRSCEKFTRAGEASKAV
ncbi:hypothetical protein Y032_0288g1465 [Ancylostoma ceylanicum]|uniref:Uncharacterized protein n=1 Tax=Ancylostoma ceylanicum TaxID=53326 RepID=A0A016S5I1_9BILA|nr:hypothetical protein Y032_0288g1465 [Ancylostoma ceylanicum]